MPSEEEFFHAINNLKENKSPGLDGLPIEFYKQFWHFLKKHYLSMILEAKELGLLPFSTSTSVLSLIHKNDVREKLTNYRPLSLSNYDYKILAYVFSERLQQVLPHIIHTDQVANVKGRYIGCHIRNILDIYDYTEKYNTPGALLLADFEKAFDSIEIPFVIAVLRKFWR